MADDLAGNVANVVTAYYGFNEDNVRLQKSPFENSLGSGLIVAPKPLDYGWEDPKWNNTFTNNVSGDVLKLN